MADSTVSSARFPDSEGKLAWLRPFVLQVSARVKNAWAIVAEKDGTYLSRERKFRIGMWLALWPVVVVTLGPSQFLNGFGANLLSTNRLPEAIFCMAALLSEFAALMLFMLTRRRFIDRPEDRLTFWSEIAASAAGVCTLAFVIAALANAMQVW